MVRRLKRRLSDGSRANCSSDEMASRVAERIPNLSLLRYLQRVNRGARVWTTSAGETHLPWCPLKLKVSVPAMRFAMKTCLTSCGSAVEGESSTMFSTALAKTLPLASHARQVGGRVGSTNITGPAMSVTASADTHDSSSSSGCCNAPPLMSFDAGPCPSASSSLLRLRFLTFLSPLKLSGLTMFRLSVGGRRWLMELG